MTRLTLAQAIAREEGFYVTGSRAERNHNPGNLEYGAFAIAHGAEKSDGRFAIFPDPLDGFEALEALLKFSYSGLTIERAIRKYAPESENDTERYLANVCQWTGLKPSDLVTA
jgi:hypothetical protein